MNRGWAVLALVPLLLLLPAAAVADPVPIFPPLPIPSTLPLFWAGACTLGDVQVGEQQVVGLQCSAARFASARPTCDIQDAGMDCSVEWTVEAKASRWLTAGAANVEILGPCARSGDASWSVGGAALSVSAVARCTTGHFWVTRGTCVHMPARLEASFTGLLAAPEQALAYITDVCDNRDPA